MLTDAALTDLIKTGESDRVEFTESVKDLDKIRRAVCAFANDLPNHQEPGLVFIGVRDDGSCAGLRVDDALLQTLSGVRGDGKVLPFPVMEVGKRTLDGCEVAVVQVAPTDNPPIRMDGRSWIRVGPSTRQATVEEERRLAEKRRLGIGPYDMFGVPGTSIDSDLDLEQFRKEFLPAVVPKEVLAKNQRGVAEQLLALRLTTQEGLLTVTAVLMLGSDPQRWVPDAYIQFVRFDGQEMTDPVKDHEKLVGTLPQQLQKMDEILRTNIAVELDIRKPTHANVPDYPRLALRELVHNAVIHRTYEGVYTPVRVYWYTDRVEISSPGGVFGSVTKENFAQGQTSYRNPTIAEAMKNLGLMQQFGFGLRFARDELLDNGNPPVQFDVHDTSILARVQPR